MKILYVSSVPNREEFNYITSKIKEKNQNQNYGMAEASYKFHNLIIDGFIQNDCKITSLIGRSVSFKTHKGLFWKNKKYIKNNIIYNNIAFINFPVLKQISICFGMFKNIIKWLKDNSKTKDKTIIIDGAYVTLLPIVNFATIFFKCNKLAIICDVYSYMAEVDDARGFKKWYHKLIAKFLINQYQKINGYVFMTEEMSKLPAFSNKDYIVIEGIVNSEFKYQKDKKMKNKVVMYAGALKKEYGLERLVKAFNNYQNANAELWLYGNGNYVDTIKKYSQEDKRIKYMGKASLDEIVELEKKVTLLVNPRFTNKQFTKYSFPSKNMEYMLSGTPLLTSKLPGMPKEYYDYVYLIDNDSEKALTKALENILSKKQQELDEFGKKSHNFVLKNKNNIIQSQKILGLAQKIVEERNV